MVKLEKKELETSQSYKTFPWTYNTTNMFIDLYAQRLDYFLSPSRGPITPKLKEIMDSMKQELANEYNQSVLDILNTKKLSSKFTSLKKSYKKHFFDLNKSDQDKETLFAHYSKMNAMFTDYAKKNLMEADITDTDVKNFIAVILGGKRNSFSDEAKEDDIVVPESMKSQLLNPGNVFRNNPEVESAETSRLKEESMNQSGDLPSFVSDTMTPFVDERKFSSNTMKRKLQNALLETKNKFMKTSKPDQNKIKVEASEFIIDTCNDKDIYDDDVKVLFSQPSSISKEISPDNRLPFSRPVKIISKNTEMEVANLASIKKEPVKPSIDNQDSKCSPTNLNIQNHHLIDNDLKVTQINEPSTSEDKQDELSLSKPPAWFEIFLKQYNSDMEIIKKINDNVNRIVNNKI